MFDQMSWICPAWSVGTSVPKSSPTSSYLSPRHFIAASIMSGSWPTILLGLFGSRYMIGGSVGSSPTLRVLPASPGYLVATLSGSHAACAGCAPTPSIVAATSPTTTAPLRYLIPEPPFLTRSGALHARALGARVAPMAQEMPPAPELTHELPVARDDLAPRQGQHEQPLEREAVERVVARARVQPPLVHYPGAGRIEQDEVGIAAHRDRALLRVEPEDAGGIGRESGHEGLQRNPPPAHAFRVDHRHFGLEPGHAIRHLGEVLGSRRLLLDRPRGVVAADGLDVARAQSVPQRGLIPRGAERRGAHELGCLGASALVALLGQGQVDRARLRPHPKPAPAGRAHRLEGVGAGEMHDVDLGVDQRRVVDGAPGGLRLREGGAALRVGARVVPARGQESTRAVVEHVAVLGVDVHHRPRLPRRVEDPDERVVSDAELVDHENFEARIADVHEPRDLGQRPLAPLADDDAEAIVDVGAARCP